MQLIVFMAGSVASLAFIRPIAKSHLHTNKVWIIPSEFTQALGQIGSIIPDGNSEGKS